MKLCWFYQRALSWTFDSDSGPPGWLARHLQACPDCRRSQQRQSRLVSALVAAASQRKDIPPFLHARIISRLNQVPIEAPASLPALNWPRALAIPALGVLVLLGYLSRQPEKVQ